MIHTFLDFRFTTIAATLRSFALTPKGTYLAGALNGLSDLGMGISFSKKL